MRINQIITESSTTEFKERFPDTTLYHGMGKNSEYPQGGILKFRYRDKPKDSSPMVHNYTNHLAQKKFGIPIRNLFFAVAEELTAETLYGNVVVVVPSDGFRMFINKDIVDFTSSNSFELNRIAEDMIEYLIDEANSSVIDQEVIEALSDNDEKLIQKLIKSQNNSSSFEEFYSYSMQVIREIIEWYFSDTDFIENVQQEMDNNIKSFIEDIKKRCEDYVSGVDEIKSSIDLKGTYAYTEIMILADKFYVTKLED